MAVEACPRSLPWRGLGLASHGVLGPVMLVLHLARDALADGAEDVPGRGPLGLVWAALGVVRHVHPGACLVELQQGYGVQQAPGGLGGRVPDAGLLGSGGPGLWAKAHDGEAGCRGVEGLPGGGLPCLGDAGPDCAGLGALCHLMRGGLLAAVASL